MVNLFQGQDYAGLQEINKSLLSDGQFSFDSNGLAKALTAGEGVGSNMTDLNDLTGGRAITVENIDRSLKVTAEKQQDLVMWNLLRKKPIYAVLDQYMVLSDHGLNTKRHAYGTFRTETAFPKVKDVTLERKVDVTKFLRDMRELGHVMAQVDAMADQHTLLNNAGALAVMIGFELATIFGNSAIMPTQFDGFIKKLTDAKAAGYDAVIDVRNLNTRKSKGGQLTEEMLDEGARLIQNSFGRATDLVLPSTVKGDLNTLLTSAKRVYANNADQTKALLAGLPVSGFRSDFAYNGWGDGSDPHFKFRSSIDSFFPSGESNDVKAPAAAFPNSTDAPVAPKSVTVTVESDASSEFLSADSGNYYYKVASINADGQSIPVAGNALAAPASGQKVKLVIAANDAKITGYIIYRSAMDAADNSDCRWVVDTVATAPTGNTTWYDLNGNLPGTNYAVLISNSEDIDAVDVRQLMPFMRMQLPFGLNGSVAYPYLYMLYCYMRTPKLRVDRTQGTMHILFKNIGHSQSTF